MVIRFYHGVSHNIKAVAGRFDIQVVFKNDFRLLWLTLSEKVAEICSAKHKQKPINCKEGVVYQIPLVCGFMYIGHTERCLNTHLTEHKRNVKNNAAQFELVQDIMNCGNCYFVFDECALLSIESKHSTRLIKYTSEINMPGNCVSKASF